jgi:hypothetical protein
MKRALILLTSLGLLVACEELQPKDKPKEPEPPPRSYYPSSISQTSAALLFCPSSVAALFNVATLFECPKRSVT